MGSGINGNGRRFLSSFLFALLFIVVGIIIASMLDLPSRPVASDSPIEYNPLQSPARENDFSTPFIKVVAAARDAVVNITAESEGDFRGRSLDEYFRFFGLTHPRTQRSYGSGFIFRKDGYVLTNNHVIANMERVWVTLSDQEKYTAQVVGTDPATDLAVLRIDTENDLPVIPFGHSDELQIGEWVVAIGNPFPEQGLERTVTAGVVSAKGRKNLRFADGNVLYQNYIQTDASINPGNSGGPLLNLKAEAIGVNAAITSPTGTSVGIGFAIPIDFARAVVPDLIAHGEVTRGWLGVSDLKEIPREKMEELDLKTPAVTFERVLRGSPASEAGLRPLDIIYGFDGKTFADVDDFRFLVATAPVGKSIDLDVIRDGTNQKMSVTIGNRSEAMQAIQSPRHLPYSDEYWLGMEVTECTPELAYQLGVECPPDGGVIVTNVIPGSPAYNRNIVPGVIIIEIDKYEIKDISDYRDAVVALKDTQKSISFIIYDTEGNTRWVGISPTG